jgi:F-type H+-transporting ATPase subunit alpha
LFEFIEGKYPEIFSELAEKKEISDDLDEKMKKALTEFDDVFQAA